MPLTDKLDEVLTFAERLDRAQWHTAKNLPPGHVDPAPLRAQLETAKTALLEDCLSKSETVAYLREIYAQLAENLVRDRAHLEAHPESLTAQKAASYSQAAAYYVGLCLEIVEKGPPESAKPPDPPSPVPAPSGPDE